MIRRTPTLIPMTDSDVQDVRDLVDKQRQAQMQHHQLMLKMKRLAAAHTYTQEDREMFEQLRASAVQASKAQAKAQRIGLQPDASSSSTANPTAS
ncbi:hypothetical protein D9619_002033 [Psilocybe cf. subviscida]|uniref:Uncharacterized protein n=1 Tax=Psilocybe cf. subviscida TaxID=2480587 RepID=A0A8H5F403_9AGAR|nr:hypothetical protein D9619_002033 [Psilocybe cf. subviscida]